MSFAETLYVVKPGSTMLYPLFEMAQSCEATLAPQVLASGTENGNKLFNYWQTLGFSVRLS